MNQTPIEGRIGPYRLIRRLGEGGMGVVHLAYDEGLGRRVALKVLRQTNPAMRERLEREAHLHARVEHPAVCRLYQVGEHEGWPYLVMQYIEGQTIDHALAASPLDDVLRVFAQLADAVHAAHLQGLIHRDLKPANLMVARDEAGGLHPYVMDFGLARDDASGPMTDDGVVPGRPTYNGPEQGGGGVRGSPHGCLWPGGLPLRNPHGSAALPGGGTCPGPCANPGGSSACAKDVEANPASTPRDHPRHGLESGSRSPLPQRRGFSGRP